MNCITILKEELTKILILMIVFSMAFMSARTVEAQTRSADTDAEAMDNNETDKIQLVKKFFKPLRYKFGDREPENVYKGFGFSPGFEKTMSLHPSALREVKRSKPYALVATGGSIAILVLTIKELADTVGDVNKLNDGKMVDGSAQFSDLVPLLVAAGVTVTASLIAGSHFKKGIEIFNKRQARGARHGVRGRIAGGMKYLGKFKYGFRVADPSDEPFKGYSASADSRMLQGVVSLNF